MRFDQALDHALFTSSPAERREMMLLAEQERAESRRRELDLQRSPQSLPEERIRLWERLHALQLPRTEGHPLIAVIAEQTQLSVQDVRSEQIQRRLQREAATSQSPAPAPIATPDPL